MTFLSKFGLGSYEDSRNFYNEELTVTFQNKSKAEKKLFNFPNATKTLDDMDSLRDNNSRMNQKRSVNTLDKYFGKKGRIEEVEIPTDEEQKMIEHGRFVSIL